MSNTGHGALSEQRYHLGHRRKGVIGVGLVKPINCGSLSERTQAKERGLCVQLTEPRIELGISRV